jgi:cell division protein FtsI/penicillin-binding protein 2
MRNSLRGAHITLLNKKMRRIKTDRIETRKLWDEDPVKIPFQKSRKRAVVLVTIVLFCFAAIFLRLINLMVLDHDKLSQRASQQYIKEKVLTPQRGVIWDRRMKEIATNIETDSLFAVPSQIEDTRTLSSEISPIIKVSTGEIDSILSKRKKKSFAWLARRMDLDTSRKLSGLKERFNDGEIGFVREPKRCYPKGQIASHLWDSRILMIRVLPVSNLSTMNI